MARAAFERHPSSVAGNLHDSISLLWRLELCAVNVGERWQPFAAIARDRLDRQGLLFHAAHLAMALAGAGEWATAERQLDMLRERAPKDRTGLVGAVLIPLVEGLHAFAAGDYRCVIERLEPLRSRIVELGGSRAQRDVFHDTLLEACFRAGDAGRAWRLAGRACGPETRRLLVDAQGTVLGSVVRLTLAALGLVGSSLVLAATPNLVEAPRTFLFFFVLMFAAYIAVLSALPRLGQGRTLGVLLAVAVAARLVWLVASPTLSTDAYRYVWDARVAQAGINPYAYAAAAPEVAHLRDAAIYPRLNHATWRTIYPPGAQAFFRAVYAVAPDSVLAIKIALGAVELLGLGVLVALLRALDLPRNRIVVYAWNPLVLVEVWGSAHLDALVVTGVIAMALALVTRRPAVAAALLGLATLVKLYPVMLLPLLARLAGVRVVVVFVLVVALGYAPALGSGLLALGSLPRYLEQEYFNPGLARSVIDSPMVSMLAMAAWIAWVVWWRRPSTFVDGALPLTGGFAVLSPNVFPWYVLWVVPFLAVKPSPCGLPSPGRSRSHMHFSSTSHGRSRSGRACWRSLPSSSEPEGRSLRASRFTGERGVHNEMTFRPWPVLRSLTIPRMPDRGM